LGGRIPKKKGDTCVQLTKVKNGRLPLKELGKRKKEKGKSPTVARFREARGRQSTVAKPNYRTEKEKKGRRLEKKAIRDFQKREKEPRRGGKMDKKEERLRRLSLALDRFGGKIEKEKGGGGRNWV